MDDSFAFRTTVPLRRQFDPRLLKTMIVGALVLLGTGLFAAWVVASERESFAHTHHRVAPSEVTITGIDRAADPSSTDADAEKATGLALAAARTALEGPPSKHRPTSIVLGPRRPAASA